MLLQRVRSSSNVNGARLTPAGHWVTSPRWSALHSWKEHHVQHGTRIFIFSCLFSARTWNCALMWWYKESQRTLSRTLGWALMIPSSVNAQRPEVKLLWPRMKCGRVVIFSTWRHSDWRRCGGSTWGSCLWRSYLTRIDGLRTDGVASCSDLELLGFFLKYIFQFCSCSSGGVGTDSPPAQSILFCPGRRSIIFITMGAKKLWKKEFMSTGMFFFFILHLKKHMKRKKVCLHV